MVASKAASVFGATDFKSVGKAQVCEALFFKKRVIFIKPQTYMNLSGEAVVEVVKREEAALSSLIIVHDDLDLLPGTLRIRQNGGHGGHNGIRSIIDELLSPEFIRLKVGIGRPPPEHSVTDHVLGAFSPEEEKELPTLIDHSIKALKALIVDGPQGAMNQFHN
jgi:PTH1 family peptidyl-tRNA hydrolase